MQIPEEIKEQVKAEFADLKNKVKIKVFTSQDDCTYCNDTEELIKGVSELSDKIEFESKSIKDEEAKKYEINLAPSIIFETDNKISPIRFNGIPAGYEFSSLIETIKFLSTNELDIPANIVDKIKAINKNTNIKVFVTVSCPYCPQAVITGFKFAMINPQYIKAEMYEASEFPELANKYGVRAVPKVVINDKISFEGALPVDSYLSKVLEA